MKVIELRHRLSIDCQRQAVVNDFIALATKARAAPKPAGLEILVDSAINSLDRQASDFEERRNQFDGLFQEYAGDHDIERLLSIMDRIDSEGRAAVLNPQREN